MKYFLIGLYIFSFIFQIILTIHNRTTDRPKKVLTYVTVNSSIITLLLMNLFVDLPLKTVSTLILISMIWEAVFIVLNLKTLDKYYKVTDKRKADQTKKVIR